MDREQAKNIIINTFENHFSESNYVLFLKNLLKSFEENRFSYQGNYIPDAFKRYISSFERIGKYVTEDKEVDLLIVQLQKETSLERARTMQRNFVAWYLKGSRGGKLKDAALVAFVSPDSEDWRFSLVKMDYRFEETPSGKVKVEEEFTPARRWSFLVGRGEKSHTAQSRFIPILENDDWKPTLEDLEQAFNVEVVTKEFFKKYRDLFIKTKLELDKIVKNDTEIRQEFEEKNINTVDFAKKLLGQITFLYFLQKKGWFGVERGKPWGTGPKDFMRRLFNREFGDYRNFYNDILEPLFYEALSTNKSAADHYYSRFNCKIPFLNGGLFDPINNYDWVKTNILIPNELFSNTTTTREGDIGDGILDVFDRYNFTVNEEEPLEKEVALDPELLGKIYEKLNAIRPDNFDTYDKALKSGSKDDETKFNKEYGVYYTPKEIVHYMCQESLINYLATETSCARDDIEMFVKISDSIQEHEMTSIEKQKLIEAGEINSTKYESQIPECIRNNAKQIDSLLSDIKVCDPAVGSGAFPIGMMHEIVKLRRLLSIYVTSSNTDIPVCESIHITRRILPHWFKQGAIYWVTFRLADSIPQNKIEEWKTEYETWENQHPKPWSKKDWKEYNIRFGEQFENWLDAEHGSCVLARKDIREKVKECIMKFDGERLKIHGAVIMPNHVHLLIEPFENYSLSDILKGMKGASAREINKILGTTGKRVWMEESYDHVVRNEEEYLQFIQYIRGNPIKANLSEDKYWLYVAQDFLPIVDDDTQTRMSVLHSTYDLKRHAIENSLYGVDIDPGAVEICKLRFWLSMIVDEEDFHNIKPLPNLDYKVVCGNSLLGVEKDLYNHQDFSELEELKPQYFSETNPITKQHLKNEIDKLIYKITKGRKEFDFEVYFSEVFHEKRGFDIVIANPPYGADYDKLTINKLKSIYKYYDRQSNSASFFIERGSNLVKDNGTVAYIVPKSLSFSKGWQKTRKFITEINTLNIIADVSKSFENVLLEAIIVSFSKRKIQKYSFLAAEGWSDRIILTSSPTNELVKEFDILPVYVTPERLEILRKILLSSIALSTISRTFRGLSLQSKVSRKGDNFILRGKNIGKYKIYGEIDKVTLPKDLIYRKKTKDIMQKKIVSQNIVAHVLNPYDKIIIMATLDEEGMLTLDTVMNTIVILQGYTYKYILALLNSQLASWFYYWFVYNRAIRTMHFDEYYIGKLPIKNITSSNKPIVRHIEELVDTILAAKRANHAADTSHWEKEIDELVYQLYSLTEEEIAIVEGKNNEK